MTTAEALAVVREALAYAPFNESEHIRHPAYSALALIEERLEELERKEKVWAQRHLDEQRAAMRLVEKAEAERDEARKEAREADEDRDHVHRRNLAAEQRVAELEAALREIADAPDVGLVLGIARRALGGGEV